MSQRHNYGQRRIRVTPEVIEAWLVNENAVETDLPEDARFVRLYPDSDESYGCYFLVFESSQWEELREGEPIPLIEPEVSQID